MDTYGASAEDNKPVMVQATVTSVHDRLPPYEGHNIVVEEHYTFRLTGGSRSRRNGAIVLSQPNLALSTSADSLGLEALHSARVASM
jgi:hypothetical protein